MQPCASFGLRNNERRATADSGVRSVEAALRVVELLACGGAPLRLTEIARALGLSKPRVCRHLATLQALGFVRRVGRAGWAAGERLAHIAQQVVRGRSLGECAQAQLEALRDELGLSVTLAVPAAGGAVVLDCCPGHGAQPIRVTAGTLLRYPHSPAARLAVALSPALSPVAADSAAALERWRTIGADYEADTQGTGLGGVAAPVFAGEKLLALVSVVLPTRLLLPRPPRRLLDALRRTVAAIEARIAPP